MTRLIAHRGLMRGPNPALENHPDQILGAFEQGFDCEIDLWYIDGNFLLGHDSPTYDVSKDFLADPRLWIHCKNHDALREMRKQGTNYFWHQEDDITLTSYGYFWTYPGKPLYDCSICVMPEWTNTLETCHLQSAYGICSDFVKDIDSRINGLGV